MEDKYFSLKVGDSKKQSGVVLRQKGADLEEMTGFVNFEKIGEVKKESSPNETINIHFYEANINTDGRGNPKGKEDIIGIMVPDYYKLGVDIYKQPDKGAKLSKISMSEAAKIIEDIKYLRDAEAYIYDSF